MSPARRAAAVVLLVLEAGLAALAVLVHYGLTAEYGDVTASPVGAMTGPFRGGVGWEALVVVGLAAAVAFAVSPRRWMRMAAAALPALMVLSMVAVTPLALDDKLEAQYAATPQCLWRDGMSHGPGARAARQSQKAVDSIDHVGLFTGGGSSGVGGCDRRFVLLDEVDVLAHYRRALPEAGWQVVEDDTDHLRAERGDMEFVVLDCGGEGVVWAGAARNPLSVRCDRRL